MIANWLRVVIGIGIGAIFAGTAVVGLVGQFICYLLLKCIVGIFGLCFCRGQDVQILADLEGRTCFGH